MKKTIKNTLKIISIIGIIILIKVAFDKVNNNITTIPLKNNTELLFFEKGKTGEEVLKEHNCTYVINGSYFGETQTESFYPAGIRYQEEEKLYTGNTFSNDPNLTNTIIFYQNTDNLDFIFNNTIREPKKGTIIFNSGPGLLENGKIHKEIKNTISHWGKSVPRTILAKNKEKKNFLIVFKKGISLYNCAKWIKENNFTDAINLDGGPSTTFVSKNFWEKNFNEKKKLPIFFCIK